MLFIRLFFPRGFVILVGIEVYTEAFAMLSALRKNKIAVLVLTGVLAFALCACSGGTDAGTVPVDEAPAAAAADTSAADVPAELAADGETAEWTVLGQRVDAETEALDLRGITPQDVDAVLAVLPKLTALKTAALGTEAECALSWGNIARLVQAREDVDFDYTFSFYGKPFTLLDRKVDINHVAVSDEGALARQIIPCMKNLSFLDMDSCGVSNESMAALRDEFPDVKVVWRIWFGDFYSVRTNTPKILASKPSVGGLLRDSDVQVLKYCTDVLYLDLGHNEIITDISFAAYMPKLRVAILAMNMITDLTPLASCPKLEYLEIQTNPYITDLSPLAACTELEHLNVSNCRGFDDITPILGLNKLKRFWLGCSAPVPEEQKEEFARLHPDCEFNTTVWSDPTSEGWRIDHVDPWTNEVFYDERYELLLAQFGYLENAYSFISNDPLYYPHD